MKCKKCEKDFIQEDKRIRICGPCLMVDDDIKDYFYMCKYCGTIVRGDMCKLCGNLPVKIKV